MAATMPATPPWTPPCCRRRSASRCACRACATKATAGTRRRRPRSTSSRAAIDKDGKVTAWHFETKAFSQARLLQQRRLARAHARRPAAGLAAEAGAGCSACRTNPTPSARSARSRRPSRRCSTAPRRCAASHMRDPGGPQMHFAVESFMDEVALATNMDPVEFRLRYLKDPRDIARDQGGGREGRLAAACRRRASSSRATSMSARASPMRCAAAPASPSIAEVEVNRNTGKVWAQALHGGA